MSILPESFSAFGQSEDILVRATFAVHAGRRFLRIEIIAPFFIFRVVVRKSVSVHVIVALILRALFALFASDHKAYDSIVGAGGSVDRRRFSAGSITFIRRAFHRRHDGVAARLFFVFFVGVVLRWLFALLFDVFVFDRFGKIGNFKRFRICG